MRDYCMTVGRGREANQSWHVVWTIEKWVRKNEWKLQKREVIEEKNKKEKVTGKDVTMQTINLFEEKAK